MPVQEPNTSALQSQGLFNLIRTLQPPGESPCRGKQQV